MKFEGGKLCKEDLTTSFPYRYGRFKHEEKGEYVVCCLSLSIFSPLPPFS